ncbi:hypothetical protein G9A89_007521 [Geosiphon pyriformis]|nr:hypothetical protein G9A89_007521 [Geosiphon pyriformis]
MYRRYRILIKGLPAITPREELTELQFWEATDKTTIGSLSIIQKTQTKTFRYKTFRSLSTAISFKHQVMDLLFTSHLKDLPVTFGAPCEINKKIEHYTQQRYPITYTSKGKGKLQTPAVIPKRIQPSTWKKTRVESPTVLFYHYTPGSAINITSPPQQPNLDPMAYVLIVKLDNFTSEENNTQSLINKPQDFNAFKVEFLRYFSNNNSINWLANTFSTMKQKETEAVTTYLGRFHRNLCQIQAIDANYFTAPQILNQFIRGLCSSILQHVCLLHPVTLQDAVIHARDFESAESEANHAQAVNLVMNGLSELDFKLKQFSDSINQKLEEYLADNHAIYQPPQQCNNSGNTNCFQNQSHLSSSTTPNQSWQPEMRICHNCGKQGHIRVNCHIYSNQQSGNQYRNSNCQFQTPNHYPNQDQTAYLPITQSQIYQPPVYQTPVYQTPVYQPPAIYQLQPQVIYQPQPQIENRPKLEISDGCLPTDSQLLSLVNGITFSEFRHWLCPKPKFSELFNNILSATIMENEFLDAIFPFKLKELAAMPLFSGAALKEKPIMAMNTDAKANGQPIKLILNSGSAGSIITRQLMEQLNCWVDCAASARIITVNRTTKTPIDKINNFPFEINGLITPIKAPSREEPLIELDEKEEKPVWKTYQVSWTDTNHNKLPPILSWDEQEKGKRKQKEELT